MSLADHLAARIRTEGPLSLADYMGDALLHPVHGYYTTRDPLGAAGDFTTAPEISQMFGEMLGLCLAQSWLDQGAPGAFTLAELGPGRGTLMADVMRATAAVPGFHQAARIVLVEASPTLRKAQAATLAPHAPHWIDHAGALPDAPLWLVANEFFDALPIRQFVRDGAGWRERRIGLEGEALAWGLGPTGPQPALAGRLADTGDGDLVEICPALPAIAEEIGQRIESHGGAALIIDYGDWRSRGDTLQALRAHAPVDVLDTPGTADLTAHVDFEALARATPSAVTAMTPQGVFLERLGITARAQALARGLRDAALDSHIAAHRRLTHPQEMGNLFKVLGFHPARAIPPAGFQT
ncbi:class I SAM-dependent methyltransferase [Marinibacterium sp. SX1]|uniref:class I SAM-dependent methyltransferase n=1 Tax=Marinibacterium sp. SX1 TaxID=3388424 RepID=UPI003D167038